MGVEPLPLDPKWVQALQGVTTATLTTVLLKKGLRNVWMRGAKAMRPDTPRIVGRVFTLRFVPAREDLATPASWGSPISTRAAIEQMPAGCIAVVDAMGVTDAGIFGDILCARMQKRGVGALVTDGVVRDIEGVTKTNLPVWAQGTASPASVAALTFVGWQEPIGCGGVAVMPNDVVVVDADTGKFKRMWGAYGKMPDDSYPRYRVYTPVQQQFNLLHGMAISLDGTVYVADRNANRVQAFTLDGKFINEGLVAPGSPMTGNGSAFGVAFSGDSEQRFLYIADGHNQKIRVLDRKSLKEIHGSAFGRIGLGNGQLANIHVIANDAAGNLYIGDGGGRFQKFVFKGLSK